MPSCINGKKKLLLSGETENALPIARWAEERIYGRISG